MEPDRQRRISDLYHAALERPAGERRRFLMDACQDDAAVREEVESLLRYESGSAGFLEGAAVITGPSGASMVNRQLGPYTIVASRPSWNAGVPDPSSGMIA